MKNKIYKTLARFILIFHNFSYRLASRLASESEEGLHPKHRLMNYHKFFVDNIEPRDIVLDVGCGNGALSYDISKKVRRVVAVDISEANIKTAKKKYLAPNIEYIVGDITEYNFSETFDAVILSNVLEHIENRVEFLGGIKKLTPKILIRVPMINRDWITLYKKELGVEWRLDPTHYTEYTIESFIKEIEAAGLSIENYQVNFGEIWAIISIR